MASPVFTIEPNPHWVIIDNFSKLPNGAAIYTYRTLDPSQFKPAFQDAAGQIPYGQPIVGFGNGTMPPIFWEFDPNNPNETYYIRVYDSADPTTQQFLWDFNGLSGNAGSGGGSVVNAYDIENLIVNNVFFRNIGTQIGTPSLPTSLTLAPGLHEGFVNDPANVNVINNGPVGGDIIFAKNNTTSTDRIDFPSFTPLGIHALPGQDPTPQIYFEYNCSGAGSGETYKYVQFPVSQGVQNLSAQPVTIKIYARCNSGNPTLQLNWRQFFGSGGAPSADVITPAAAPFALTTAWQAFLVNAIVPDVTGKTLGSCGNDGLFLQVSFPLSPATTNIDFIKPQMFLGTISPVLQYDSNDEIDSFINTPRTGDTRTSLNSFALGWINMDDGTIGNASSNASARNNIDTFPLFDLIWNTFQSNQSLAPMYTSGAVAVPYGADPTTDFTANRQLALTRNLGRVMIGALPIQITQAFTTPTANTLTVASTAGFRAPGVPVTVSSSTVPQLVNGVTYYAIILTSTTMQLATSAENAIAGTPITFGIGAGTGNVIIASHALGSFGGEETHTLTISEMPSHNHTIPGLIQNYCSAGGASTYNTTGPPGNTGTSFTGGDGAHNNLQPYVAMNVFIKL
jgi:hypothetical protein